MSTEKIISANGVYDLVPDDRYGVQQSRSTTIVIIENSSAATLSFGLKSKDGTFKALADGAITDDAKINHGRGAALAVTVTDIVADTVTIGFYSS